MSKLFIFFGGPGSGKSTLAKEFAKHAKAAFYDGDDFYTLEMRNEAKRSQAYREKVMDQLYGGLLEVVKNRASKTDYVVLTHSFDENRWKDLFIDEFGDKVVFVFIQPDKQRQIKELFNREAKDSANKGRDPKELKQTLKQHIEDSTKRREFPASYVIICNDYDAVPAELIKGGLTKLI